MTHTEIGNTVSVISAPYINESYDIAKGLAREYLEGCADEYLYFYAGTGSLSLTQSFDQYILLRSDSITRNSLSGTYELQGVTVTQIFVVSSSSGSSSSFDFSGSSLDLGSDPVGSFSGSGSITSYSNDYQTAAFTYYRDSVRVESIVDNVMYSSLDNHPHLIEGVQNYAHAAFCLAVIILVFKLGDRLFRRVY